VQCLLLHSFRVYRSQALFICPSQIE